MPQAGEVKIELFDVLGRRVALLVNGEHKAGQYQVQIDASRLGLASGMYLYRMQVQDFREVRKMTFIK